MQKILTKHGNSLALIIDRPILDLLKIEPLTPLEITTDGETLTIRPVRKQKTGRKKKFDQALESVNQDYHETLKKLCE